MTARETFLIAMYNQLCNEMDRHIKIIWQIVGVLISTFAIFALVQKDILSLDYASSIIIAVCALAIAIIIESNFWYNRNLVMVANIERQFLIQSDIMEVHHYFIEHRKNNKYLDMMKIQIGFVFLIFLIIIGYHFSDRVWCHLATTNDFSFERSMPYILLVISAISLLLFSGKRTNDYNDFKSKSPGKLFQTDDQMGDLK